MLALIPFGLILLLGMKEIRIEVDERLHLDSNPLKWSVADVVRFIRSTDCAPLARIFLDQVIMTSIACNNNVCLAKNYVYNRQKVQDLENNILVQKIVVVPFCY